MKNSNSRSGHSVTELRPVRPRAFWLVAALLLCSLGLYGCPIQFVRTSLNQAIRPERVAFIVPGQTTFWDVVRELGPPDQITVPYEQVPRREKRRVSEIEAVARYRFLDLKRVQVNFTFFLPILVPALAVPGVPTGSTLGKTGFGEDEFQVALDKDWVVLAYAFSKDAENSSFGMWPFDIKEPPPASPTGSLFKEGKHDQ